MSTKRDPSQYPLIPPLRSRPLLQPSGSFLLPQFVNLFTYDGPPLQSALTHHPLYHPSLVTVHKAPARFMPFHQDLFQHQLMTIPVQPVSFLINITAQHNPTQSSTISFLLPEKFLQMTVFLLLELFVGSTPPGAGCHIPPGGIPSGPEAPEQPSPAQRPVNRHFAAPKARQKFVFVPKRELSKPRYHRAAQPEQPRPPCWPRVFQ